MLELFPKDNPKFAEINSLSREVEELKIAIFDKYKSKRERRGGDDWDYFNNFDEDDFYEYTLAFNAKLRRLVAALAKLDASESENALEQIRG